MKKNLGFKGLSENEHFYTKYGWKGKQVSMLNVLGRPAQYKQYGYCYCQHMTD